MNFQRMSITDSLRNKLIVECFWKFYVRGLLLGYVSSFSIILHFYGCYGSKYSVNDAYKVKPAAIANGGTVAIP